MALRPPSTDSPALRRVTANPFFVLELPCTASSQDVRVAAGAIAAALNESRERAEAYATPLGPRARSERLVQAAAIELLDPDRRIVHEVWAELLPDGRFEADQGGWPEALGAFGWRRG